MDTYKFTNGKVARNPRCAIVTRTLLFFFLQSKFTFTNEIFISKEAGGNAAYLLNSNFLKRSDHVIILEGYYTRVHYIILSRLATESSDA